jgi:hypothetical protein
MRNYRHLTAALLVNYRQAAAALLMVLGIAMSLRGIHHSLAAGLGWSNLLLSAVLGALVFALGLARWRYLRER